MLLLKSYEEFLRTPLPTLSTVLPEAPKTIEAPPPTPILIRFVASWPQEWFSKIKPVLVHVQYEYKDSVPIMFECRLFASRALIKSVRPEEDAVLEGSVCFGRDRRYAACLESNFTTGLQDIKLTPVPTKSTSESHTASETRMVHVETKSQRNYLRILAGTTYELALLPSAVAPAGGIWSMKMSSTLKNGQHAWRPFTDFEVV